MLDTEINIQKGLNEVGCIASKEALKYLDTDGSPLKIGEEIWKSKGAGQCEVYGCQIR
jgi:hypothetical protein